MPTAREPDLRGIAPVLDRQQEILAGELAHELASRLRTVRALPHADRMARIRYAGRR